MDLFSIGLYMDFFFVISSWWISGSKNEFEANVIPRFFKKRYSLAGI